jgi:hypothetical protein
MKLVCSIVAAAVLAHAGTVLDQIAVVAGNHPIKTSDIDRDLRVTQFLNGQMPDSSIEQRRMSAQRLIDQELIREEIAQRGNTSPLTGDAKAVLSDVVNKRYKGSAAEMDADLKKRGLTEAQVLDVLQWQMLVLRFIDQRFRPGVTVSNDDIRAYYEKNQAELKRQHPEQTTLAALTPVIRDQLEGDRINAAFETWLQQARQAASIVFKLDELK